MSELEVSDRVCRGCYRRAVRRTGHGHTPRDREKCPRGSRPASYHPPPPRVKSTGAARLGPRPSRHAPRGSRL
eukprot:scaffold3945_cov70-Phaeocystis_antarctica.AAC.3